MVETDHKPETLYSEEEARPEIPLSPSFCYGYGTLISIETRNVGVCPIQ